MLHRTTQFPRFLKRNLIVFKRKLNKLNKFIHTSTEYIENKRKAQRIRCYLYNQIPPQNYDLLDKIYQETDEELLKLNISNNELTLAEKKRELRMIRTERYMLNQRYLNISLKSDLVWVGTLLILTPICPPMLGLFCYFGVIFYKDHSKKGRKANFHDKIKEMDEKIKILKKDIIKIN